MPATPNLLQVLDQKRLEAHKEFSEKHAFAQKWLAEKGLSLDEVREHSAKLLTGVTLGSALLLSTPHLPIVGAKAKPPPTHQIMTDFLKRLQTAGTQSLNIEIETQLLADVQKFYGIPAAFELDRQRLPTYRGQIGLEQHLARFAGDTLVAQQAFLETGMAPDRGAFGYFQQPGETVEIAIEREKFYIVLQTFMIPGWDQDWVRLKDWYKFRKFLVINPETGKAVVAVLGDSGPATSTDKVFGGSPEVMAGLGLYPLKTKGEVWVLYLDDPGNQIPLGPVASKGGVQ